MARFDRWRSHEREALGALVACLTLSCLAAAQTDSSAPRPVVLNRKDATNLILAQSKPPYPPAAKENYIQGKVRIQVLVSPEGKVTEAHVVQGHPFLAAAALKEVRHWLYRPFKTAAGATAFITLVDVNFSLHNKKVNQFPPAPEKDLIRQIRPPEILKKPDARSPLVHVRVLVSDDGQVIDVSPEEEFPSHYDKSLKVVEHCKFQPAKWGTISVPWYLDVDVPVEDRPVPGDRPEDSTPE